MPKLGGVCDNGLCMLVGMGGFWLSIVGVVSRTDSSINGALKARNNRLRQRKGGEFGGMVCCG